MRKNLEENILRKLEKKLEQKTFTSETKIKIMGKYVS